MGTFRKIILVVGSIILLIVFAGFLLPDRFTAQQKIAIKAEQSRVFDTINTITTWPRWNAWLEVSSDSYQWGDTLQGKGAKLFPKDQMQKEKLRIAQSLPLRHRIKVRNRLGGALILHATIELRQKDDSTHVTWQENGRVGMNPIQRYVALMMPSYLNKVIRQSLTNLKTHIEHQQRARE